MGIASWLRSLSRGSDRSDGERAQPLITGAEALADQLARAQQMLEEGRAGDVVVELEASLERLGWTYAATWAVLGQAYKRLNDLSNRDRAFDQAFQLYENARGSPPTGEATALARALAAQGRRQDAISLLQRVVEKDPADARAWRLLARHLDLAGSRSDAASAWSIVARLVAPDEAVEAHRRAVELDPENVEYRAEFGRALLVVGDTSAAIELLRPVAESVPITHPAQCWLAEAMRQNGDPRGGMELAERVLAADPNNHTALVVRASCHADLGEFETALSDLDRVLVLNPGDPVTRRARADLLVRSGDIERALEEARRLVEDSPQDARSHAVLGRALMKAGDTVAALRKYDRAVALAPDDLDVRFDRAELLRRMGRLGEADEELVRLLERRPDSGKLVGTRAQVLAARGESKDALALFDQALELAGEVDWILGSKAELQLRLGKPEAALDTVNRLVAVKPDDITAELMRAWVLLALGDAEGAGRVAEHVIALAPAPAFAQVIYGRSLLSRDRPRDALAAFDAALAHQDEDIDRADLYALRGQAQQALSNLAGAVEDYTKALDLRPDDAMSLLRRGRCRHLLGEFETAANDFRVGADAAAAHGDSVTQSWCLAYLGETYRLQERFDAALEVLDSALELDRDSAYALGTKGQVLSELGQPEDAIRFLRAALDVESDLWWARASLAELLRLSGQYEEALAEIDAVLEATDGAWLRGTRAQVLAALGDQQQALAEFLAAWSLSPGQPWIADGFASALPRPASAEDIDKAIAMLDLAVATSPDARYVLATKAELQRTAGRPGEAFATIEHYLTENPDDAGAMGTKAHTLVELKRYDDAVAFVDEVEARGRADAFVLYARVRALMYLNEHSRALAETEALLEADQRDVTARVLSASCLSSLGRHEEAVKEARQVTEDNPSMRAVMGAAMRRCEPPQYDGAIEQLRLAISAGGDDADLMLWQTELADVLEEAGYPDEAREIRELIVGRVRDEVLKDVDAITAVGWAAMQLGQSDDAIMWLHEAAVLDPGNITIRFALGLAVLRSGSRELALGEYEDAAAAVSRLDDTDRAIALLDEAIRDLRLVHALRPPERVVDGAHQAEELLNSRRAVLTEKEASAHVPQAHRG